VDVVGVEQVRLDGQHVLGQLRAVDVQRGDDRVGERVGQRTVHHRHPVEFAVTHPAGPGEVGRRPDPGALGADRPDLAERAGADGAAQCGHGRRTQALEADLADPARLRADPLQALELGHGRHRRLLQQHVGAGSQRRPRQGGMGVDGGAEDHHVDVDRGQQRRQIAEYRHVRPDRRPLRRNRVGHRDQPAAVPVLQPAHVGQVHGAVPVHADQRDSHRLRHRLLRNPSRPGSDTSGWSPAPADVPARWNPPTVRQRVGNRIPDLLSG
jgi:hypothetical protein